MDDSIREIQLAELDIIREFKKICEKNNLRYYMMGGTFLGAIRHKGFIPWDDDADFALPRSDFDKLIKILEEKRMKYKLETFKNSRAYNCYTPKLRDCSIEVRLRSTKNERIGTAAIDLFALDGMPNNKKLFWLHTKRLGLLRGIYALSDFENVVNVKRNNRPLYEKLIISICKTIHLSKLLDAKKALKNLDRCLRKYTFEDSEKVVNYMGSYHMKEMFNKEVYDKTSFYEFEGLKLPAPSNYDLVLTQMYGEYMKIPPEHQRNKHESKIIRSK